MTKPWSHQASLKRERDRSPEVLYRDILTIPNERDQALVALCYLTGGRISEIVRQDYLRKVHFAKGLDGKRIIPPVILDIELEKINYKGITRRDITTEDNDGQQTLIIDMQNRKNREAKRKTIPILPDKEMKFIEIILNYSNSLESDDTPLFPFNKHRAYQIISKALGINPHFIRDIRATHLVKTYKFDAFRLTKYMGWADARPAKRYVQLEWRDIWK